MFKTKITFILTFIFIVLVGISDKVLANVSYNLNITLYPSQRMLEGYEEITFVNESGKTLNELYFNLGLNNSYDTRMKINEVIVSEKVLTGNYYQYEYLEKLVEDRSVYKISLPSPLEEGESIIIKIKFELGNLTKTNDLIFLDDSIQDLQRSSWYPRLIFFSNGNWQKKDFFSADYDVVLTVPNEENPVTSSLALDTEKLRNGQKKISYKSKNARGFAIVTSSLLISDNNAFVNGIFVRNYFKANKNPGLRKMIIPFVQDIISFYSKKFGFYPEKNLLIIPGNKYQDEGYANSNMIVVHDTPDYEKITKEKEEKLRWILAYNIAKQYFGYYLSESGEYPRWITSGASLYLAYDYFREKNLPYPKYKELTEEYISAGKAGFNTKIWQPVNTLSRFDFDWERIIEKGKSSQVFKMLENITGKKVLYDTLGELLERYPNGFVNNAIFQELIEFNSGKDLSWFFNQWIREDKNIDYAIASIKQAKTVNGKYQAKIIVRRYGDAVMPVSIAVSLKDGTKVFQVWEGNKTEAELTFEYNFPVTSAHLDPAGILPDIDSQNN